MITPQYVQTMARYNMWQNKQLLRIVEGMDQPDLDLDRGAFFGSIQGTLSHLLWCDQLWMARFDEQSVAPTALLGGSRENFATKSDWVAARGICDSRIRDWADGLSQSDLNRTLTWLYSGTTNQVTKPIAFCITHFLNHQTHHRGQVHAMLTAAGQDAPVSDLSYLPEDM